MGENIPCYRKRVSWTGIEPDRSYHPHLYREAKRAGLKRISLRTAYGEALPFRDGSVDAVVATYVLCSVESPARVLSEVLRVLKSGGEFIFLEHVAAPRGSRKWWIQKATKPIWVFIGAGCRPDLDTAAAIRRANFRALHLEEFTVDRPIDNPHIAGYAVK